MADKKAPEEPTDAELAAEAVAAALNDQSFLSKSGRG